MLSTVVLGLAIAWLIWSGLSLLRNYQTARRIGLPTVIEPVSSLNLGLIIGNTIARSNPWLESLRQLLIHRLMRFSYMGWQFDQGHRVTAEIGPAFSLVTPGSLHVIVADASAAHDLLTRRKDFIKPREMYEVFDIFGPTLNSVEGHDWQRHRRLTAPSLNETVSSSVWQQSLQQAQDMLRSWKSKTISTTADDAASVALNVFTACGFGVSTRFGQDSSDTQMSYQEAVMTILRRYPVLFLLSERLLALPFMPRATKKLHKACQQFRTHVNSMLNRADEHSTNLLSNLIKASNAEKSDQASVGLTNEEILGNMFIFTLAGHETTANTVSTAIFYLARYPKYQEWIREELEHVLRGQEDTASLDYAATFPKLQRCLALMVCNMSAPESAIVLAFARHWRPGHLVNFLFLLYSHMLTFQSQLETLRIHGSIVFIPRSTPPTLPQPLTIAGTTYTIPANTITIINNHAIQLNPETWGDDSEQWKPDRWLTTVSTIDSGSSTSANVNKFASETLYHPPPGTFIPWADGPRNCPGKKFSQVEFVAIMVGLLRRHSVAPAIAEMETKGQSLEVVNRELDGMIADSAISSITMQIRRPGRVGMVWREVE